MTSHLAETVFDSRASDWTVSVFDCTSFCWLEYRMDTLCKGKTCNSIPWLELVPSSAVVSIFQDLEKLWTKGGCQTLREFGNLPTWSMTLFVNERFLPRNIMAMATTTFKSSAACSK
jgi:hypothetical protein